MTPELLPQAAPTDIGDRWARLQSVIPAIAAIKVTATRSFQDGSASSHGGTGFVVDAEQGLLLTNRHVCTCGPQRAFATFVGCPAMEEVKLEAVYIDPAHDFAILRFDPAELEQTPHAQIELFPGGCKVGEEIRVIGNDSLEKLQILSGTIARVDRNPPELPGDYVDENTFYVLAGSGTRGGSSGSPVLNSRGQAVALNAAAVTGTMHGFFLPLHRIVRALQAVRQGNAVPRGTLCTALHYISFPETLRLGVTKEFLDSNILAESQEAPAGTTFSGGQPGGLLKVQRSIPGTEAAQKLQPGDVLLRLNKSLCFDFVVWDDALDSAVGETVHLEVCRGGTLVEVDIRVQDLHSFIPHSFAELALGVFHNLPYHTAMKHCIALKGVYVAGAGFVFGEAVRSDAVILELNGLPCDNLPQFEEALASIADKENFTVAWMLPKSQKDRRRHEDIVKMQRRFFPNTLWTLNRSSSRLLWSSRPLSTPALPQTAAIAEPDVPEMIVRSPLRSKSSTSDEELERGLSTASTALPSPATHPSEDPGTPVLPPRKRRRSSMHGSAVCALERTLCSVLFRTVQHLDMDLQVDPADIQTDVVCCSGAGVILDAEEGLVLTDRTTVPQTLGDIEVTLGEDTRTATVFFTHPCHSLVVLRVGPPMDGGVQCSSSVAFGKSAVFDDHGFAAGDESEFVGISDGERFAARAEVSQVKLVSFTQTFPVRWHEGNLEAVFLKEDPPNAAGGVLCDTDGQIHALYCIAKAMEDGNMHQWAYGIPTHAILPLVRHLKVNGTQVRPRVPSLEVELANVELAKLRRLPSKQRPSLDWLKCLGGRGKAALTIKGITSTGPLAGLAAEGDLLVAIDGVVVASAQGVEEQLQQALLKAAPGADSLMVKVSILTRGKEREVQVAVPLLGDDATTRLVSWHGIILRETPRSVYEAGDVPVGVHIAQMLLGSPAEADGVEGDVLVAVDGVPTSSLDAVLALPAQKPAAGGRCHLRLETVEVSGQHHTLMLEPDLLFWPTLEMKQDKTGSWSCTEVP
eukprot:CAMPEP_0178390210 /NCGR_PEP_ID=MMETSP0689_2-20121128/10526_1 /TAXON_ID=160604 /ORGANISM="Amphidinium massartii, Strain CS-259" /LENGTH=1027 /DNA_ID=CAMNT_0020010707 /DNA_START=2 /DNA_END=3085 /DNA_ORIENTATION=+